MAKICTKDVNIEGLSVTFSFVGGGTHEVRVDDFSDEMRTMFLLHGISQKLGDAYAGVLNPTIAEEKFKALLDTVKGGEWKQKKLGAGGLIVKALAEVAGMSEEAAAEKWGSLSKDEQKQLRKHPKVQLVVSRLDLERKQAAADAADDGEEDIEDFLAGVVESESDDEGDDDDESEAE